MIKLERPDKPQFLIDNEKSFTAILLAAIESHQGYVKIPGDIKDKLTKHYRDDRVRDVLFPSSFYKCSFCECLPDDGGNSVQVEHFFPKSIYPECCFDWENFLPACGKCNTSKGTLDTKINKIINPYIIDPESLISFSISKMCSNKTIGKDTIRELNLNSTRLIKARTKKIETISILTSELRSIIDDYNRESGEKAKRNRLIKLSNKVDELDYLMSPSETYSKFSTFHIKDDSDYLESKELLKLLDV
ncbi:HNH endonuclease [Photobacterium ganghwense]|uniref:HNH endonuclease n=1 Tax=Photobacterium ganghwense TaxID=320778 RepID=UPI0039F11EF5